MKFDLPENKTTVNQRIAAIAKHFGLNGNTLAKRLGHKSNGTTRRLLDAGANAIAPRFDTLVAVLEAFNISAEYLMRGEGPMFRDPNADALELIRKMQEAHNKDKEELYKIINDQRARINKIESTPNSR